MVKHLRGFFVSGVWAGRYLFCTPLLFVSGLTGADGAEVPSTDCSIYISRVRWIGFRAGSMWWVLSVVAALALCFRGIFKRGLTPYLNPVLFASR